MYRRFGKKCVDTLLTIVGVIVVTPMILVLAIIVRLKLGSPIFFRQTRPGLRGKPFTLLKFRTMTDIYDNEGRLLPDDKRLTSFGQFMRRTSLDELPEVFNVLVGDMSIVGPRPLLMQYLERYSPEQARRHEVRPGITGWAQVNGRNALSWEENSLSMYGMSTIILLVWTSKYFY